MESHRTECVGSWEGMVCDGDDDAERGVCRAVGRIGEETARWDETGR